MLGNKNQWETDYLTFDYSDPLTKHFIMRHLNKGADINGNNSYNGKSLLTIIAEGYINQGRYSLDIVRYLLAHGANPFLRDGNENSMLSIAAKNSNVQLLKIIMERVDAIKDTSIACMLKNVVVIEILQQNPSDEMLNLLLKSSIDPSYKIPGMGGKTLMHIAAELGHIKHFLVLLEMQGKIDIKDDYGNMPLDIIVSGINKSFWDMSQNKVFKELKQTKTDLEYYLAITEDQLLELEIFIKNFPEKSIITDQQSLQKNLTTVDSLKYVAMTTENQKLYDQNATNKLVLLCCTHKVKHGRVNKLVSKGADINGIYKSSARNSIHNGRSPLTKLVGRRVRSECEPYRTRILSYIRTIVKCGGDPYQSDAFGDSAISLACQKCDNELLRKIVFEDVKMNCNQPKTSISIDDIEQPCTSRNINL